MALRELKEEAAAGLPRCRRQLCRACTGTEALQSDSGGRRRAGRAVAGSSVVTPPEARVVAVAMLWGVWHQVRAKQVALWAVELQITDYS